VIATLNEQIVTDLEANRPEALERLLDEYGHLIQAIAFHILRNHADAEEVLEETMITAWRRIETLREPSALRPWLSKIAARHALRMRRSPAAGQQVEQLAAPDPGMDLESMAVRQALDDLAPRMRACLSLRYYAGLTVEETAAALAISPNTVKYHIKMGLERLRRQLDAPPSAASRRLPTT
jgi:RNA polymerase sigma-70 factor (ECF subfamily)